MDMMHITEVMRAAVENKILKEWKHDGHIDIEYGDGFGAVIDGKQYLVTIREIDSYEDDNG